MSDKASDARDVSAKAADATSTKLPVQAPPRVRLGDSLTPWPQPPKVRLGDSLMPW